MLSNWHLWYLLASVRDQTVYLVNRLKILILSCFDLVNDLFLPLSAQEESILQISSLVELLMILKLVYSKQSFWREDGRQLYLLTLIGRALARFLCTPKKGRPLCFVHEDLGDGLSWCLVHVIQQLACFLKQGRHWVTPDRRLLLPVLSCLAAPFF